MKQARVGSFTMGLTLILVGLVMLLSLFFHFSLLWVLTHGWPLILIALGVEILIFLRRKQEGEVKLRYDVLSIVFIGLILMVSTAFYTASMAFSALGAQDDWSKILNVHTEYAEVSGERSFPLADRLKISSGVSMVKVFPSDEPSIRVAYTVSSRTSNRAEGKELLQEVVSFISDTRPLLVSNADVRYDSTVLEYPWVTCTVFLPEGKSLDLTQYAGGLILDSACEKQVLP